MEDNYSIGNNKGDLQQAPSISEREAALIAAFQKGAIDLEYLGKELEQISKGSFPEEGEKPELSESRAVDQEASEKKKEVISRSDLEERELEIQNRLNEKIGRRQYADFGEMKAEADAENQERTERKQAEEDRRQIEKIVETQRKGFGEIEIENAAEERLRSYTVGVDRLINDMTQKLTIKENLGIWERLKRRNEFRGVSGEKLERIRNLRADLKGITKDYLHDLDYWSKSYTGALEANIAHIDLLWGAETTPALAPQEERLFEIRQGLLEARLDYEENFNAIFRSLAADGIPEFRQTAADPKIDFSLSRHPGSSEEKQFWSQEAARLESEGRFSELKQKVGTAVRLELINDREAEEKLRQFKDRALETSLLAERIRKRVDEENKKPLNHRNCTKILQAMSLLEDEMISLNRYQTEIMIEIEKGKIIKKIKRAFKGNR